MHDPPGAATFRTPAEAYDRHIGRYGGELARALIEASGVGPGNRRLALKAELHRRLGVGDGPFRLTARAWVATGRVP
jgi:hypothetical protein